jgi:hypothetical protein
MSFWLAQAIALAFGTHGRDARATTLQKIRLQAGRICLSPGGFFASLSREKNFHFVPDGVCIFPARRRNQN